METQNAAKTNDQFRKTTPWARVIFMGRTTHPLLGVGDQILEEIMDLEFSADDTSAHDCGSILVNDKFLVTWEIREQQEKDNHSSLSRSCFPVICCTDIYGARRKAGTPWDVPELQEMYKSHELVVTIPEK